MRYAWGILKQNPFGVRLSLTESTHYPEGHGGLSVSFSSGSGGRGLDWLLYASFLSIGSEKSARDIRGRQAGGETGRSLRNH